MFKLALHITPNLFTILVPTDAELRGGDVLLQYILKDISENIICKIKMQIQYIFEFGFTRCLELQPTYFFAKLI